MLSDTIPNNNSSGSSMSTTSEEEKRLSAAERPKAVNNAGGDESSSLSSSSSVVVGKSRPRSQSSSSNSSALAPPAKKQRKRRRQPSQLKKIDVHTALGIVKQFVATIRRSKGQILANVASSRELHLVRCAKLKAFRRAAFANDVTRAEKRMMTNVMSSEEEEKVTDQGEWKGICQRPRNRYARVPSFLLHQEETSQQELPMEVCYLFIIFIYFFCI